MTTSRPEYSVKAAFFKNIQRLQTPWVAVIFIGAVLMAVTLLSIALSVWVSVANLTLLYVAAVVFIALQAGTRAALFSAVLSFFSFNFFLTTPSYTLHVDARDDVVTLLFMTACALMVSPVASMLRNYILINQSLQQTKLENELEQLKNALLSSISHDLKSPLSSIANASETLNSRLEKLTLTEQYELFDSIHKESQRLHKYIQNLLDMTRLDAGKLKLERDWVTLGELFDLLQQRLQKNFPTCSFKYVIHNEDTLLFIHLAFIEQALYNIAENSARFTKQGTDVTFLTSSDKNTLTIQIIDEGPGIPAEQKETIFKMFTQLDYAERKGEVHQGMGLTISRGMIRAHGGDVGLNTKASRGACFEVALPCSSLPDNDRVHQR